MLDKKGVSPLIATVLLLAFAVALATVIIQIDWFKSCNIEIDTDNGKQRVCYNEETKQIEIFINNNDKKRNIVSFKTILSGNEVKNPQIDLDIGPLEQGKLLIDYDQETYGELVKLKLIPMINVSNNIEDCDFKDEIKIIPLPICQKAVS